jgi:DNA-directed RNA polymerase alpha subunit
MKGALDLSVASLILGVRGTQCLEGAGITHVGHLVARTDFDLLRISYLGRKTLKDIKAGVADEGVEGSGFLR